MSDKLNAILVAFRNRISWGKLVMAIELIRSPMVNGVSIRIARE